MAYEPKDLNVTQGLPDFNQMVEAQKNRVNLGQALQTGVNEYQQARNFSVKRALEKAEAQKATSEAGFYGRKENLVPLSSLTPDEQKTYADAVQVDPVTGVRGIPTSNLLAGRNSALTALAEEKNKLEAQHLKTEADLGQQLADVKQQMADVTAAHGKAALHTAGLQTVAETGSKAKPGLIEQLVGMTAQGLKNVAPGVSGALTSLSPGYTAQQTGLKAQQQLVGQPAPGDVNSNASSAPNGIPKVNYPLSPKATVTQAPPPPTAVTPTSDVAGSLPAAQPLDLGTSRPSTASPTSINGQRPVPVYSQEDYDALPDGSMYVDSSGQQKIKGNK